MSSSTTYATVKLTNKVERTHKLYDHDHLPDLLATWNVDYKDHRLFYHSSQLHDYLLPVGTNNTDANPGVLKFGGWNDKNHGLIHAFLHAYNQHQTLCLAPDHIWLTIAQGVSSHINANAEKFRHLLVNHEGKKEIKIHVDELRQANSFLDWRRVSDWLVDAAAKEVKVPGLTKLLACDFSTTTPDASAASKMVILDVFKKYFDYKCMLLCGIPEVVLLGTLQDWQHLQTKFRELKEFEGLGLKNWFDRLDPIISNLLATYEGNPNEEFWATVATLEHYGSGGQSNLTGWLAGFFPRDSFGEELKENKIGAEYVPTGRSMIPFILDDNGRIVEMSMLAGFFGCRQVKLANKDGIMVTPSIGWAIYSKQPVC